MLRYLLIKNMCAAFHRQSQVGLFQSTDDRIAACTGKLASRFHFGPHASAAKVPLFAISFHLLTVIYTTASGLFGHS